jgi:hypothetical protein
VIPVATRAYRVRVAVAAVQFSRAVREGWRAHRRHGGRRWATRSLKTQQHARARARRSDARGASTAPTRKRPTSWPRGRSPEARRRPARPGSVDMLGRTVGGCPAWSLATEVASGAGGAVPHGHRSVLPRKEVIQPHLPVRLPCYDFTPVTSPTFDGSLPQGVRPPASGVAHSRGVTGGVYKTRERIHRGDADPRLLATPPSCRRVSACNPNRDAL